MEHSQAIEMNAPDRYVLGQLSAAEADAFEEHYFDCATCADDVRLGMTIMEGGRRLVRETSEPAAAPAPPMAPVVPIDSRSRWSKWIPASAAAAVLALAGNFMLLTRMQNVAPRVVQVAAAPDPASALGTGEVLVLGTQRSGEPFEITDTLVFNIEPETHYETYTVQILDAAGKVVSERQYPSELVTKKPISIDGRVLQPGSYQLVIFGAVGPAGQPTKIAREPFIVKREMQRGQMQ